MEAVLEDKGAAVTPVPDVTGATKLWDGIPRVNTRVPIMNEVTVPVAPLWIVTVLSTV
jgi:hypothetical protein